MLAVSWNHGRKDPARPAAPTQPGRGGIIRPEAVPRQPELVTLPFEMTPWRILDGDWPRLSWYEHLLPAVARTGQLRGWSPSVQEHVRNTLRSLIATQPADARSYPASAVQRLGAGARHSTARTIELLSSQALGPSTTLSRVKGRPNGETAVRRAIDTFNRFPDQDAAKRPSRKRELITISRGHQLRVAPG